MPDHICPHEKDFGTLEKSMQTIEKDLYDNGQRGIITRFIVMEAEHIELKDDLKKLATSFSALAKSQVEQDVTKRLRTDALKAFGKFVAIGGTIIGVLYLVLDHVG